MENLHKPTPREPMVMGEAPAEVHRRWRDWHNAEADRFTALAEAVEHDLERWKGYRDEAVRHRLLAWECETEIALLAETKEAA